MQGKFHSQQADQLCLFDLGGIDLAKLRESRTKMSRSPRAPLTLKGYASDWLQFTRWCDQAGRNPLPASADTVALYVTWMLFEKHRRLTTTERHISAIVHFHREKKFSSPVSEEIRNICSGTRRERKEKPRGKAALSADQLASLAESCDDSTNIGVRDRAIIVFGFGSALRRSNLSALRLAHITFKDEGIAVEVPYSKTDQTGRGRFLEVWRGECSPLTDPVATLQAWIRCRGQWAGALFAACNPRGNTIQHRGLTGDAINDVLKRALSRVSIDPAPYGAHSLRAGSITTASENGATEQEILGLSGHANAATMRRYIRSSQLFLGRNPLSGSL